MASNGGLSVGVIQFPAHPFVEVADGDWMVTVHKAGPDFAYNAWYFWGQWNQVLPERLAPASTCPHLGMLKTGLELVERYGSGDATVWAFFSHLHEQVQQSHTIPCTVK